MLHVILHKMNISKMLLTIYFLSIGINFYFLTCSVSNSQIILQEKIENAILSECWEKATQIIEKIDVNDQNSVHKIINGHALLALNRNNESVSIFYQITFQDIKRLIEWSDSFVSEYHTNSTPYYFLGDIFARIGEIDKADNNFSKAIEINKQNYLALNARGVILVLRNEFDKAGNDFNSAININPNFLDTYNNIGMMRIHQSQGRRGAMRNFRYLKNKSQFALAYHGLGCIELLKFQKLNTDENENINKAIELCPVLQHLFIENENRFKNSYIDKQADLLFSSSNKEGTTLEKKIYKIQSFSSDLYRLHSLKENLSPNVSDFHKNMINSREIKLQEQIYRNVKQLSPLQLNAFAIKDPVTYGHSLNAVSQAEQRNIDYFEKIKVPIRRTELCVDTVNNLVGGRIGPINDFTKHLANIARNHILKDISDISQTKANMISGIDNRIKHEMSNGNYVPASIPTPMDRIKDSITIPGKRPNMYDGGGITMNKNQINWDDNKWPFVPIFGLLYFQKND